MHRRDAHGWARKRPGPDIAVEALVPLIPATAYRAADVGEHPYWCVTLTMRLPTLSHVRIVVSDKRAALTGHQVVPVTNRRDWAAAKRIGLHLRGWPTEAGDHDSQGHPGGTAYRPRRIEALGAHGCLVCVASPWRPLTWLPAGPGRTRGLSYTVGRACRHQGCVVLQQLLVCVHDQ